MDRVISMVVMSKKLYVKQTNGTAAGCNIYTTAAEAGDKALTVRADGVAGYVALKPITDANATAGRVSIGTMTYAIATQHTAAVIVPYTEQQWTKAGTYTFVVPAGVSRVRVAVCGGGQYGGSGGYDSQYVAVTTGHTYTLTVGKAGGTNGVNGFILLAYGGDVQNG